MFADLCSSRRDTLRPSQWNSPPQLMARTGSGSGGKPRQEHGFKMIQIYHSLWRTLELKAREHGPAPELTDSSTGTPSESSAKKRSRADS